jgi:hypothetical protein
MNEPLQDLTTAKEDMKHLERQAKLGLPAFSLREDLLRQIKLN